MTHFENEFEGVVKSVRFDDTPSETHRRQLEERVLEAWDRRPQTEPAPSGVFYLKRAAIAAGFVVAAGLLYMFWDGDGVVTNGHPAHTPDPQRVEQIYRQENASGAQKLALQREIQEVWKLIAAEDTESLSAVVMDGQATLSVRQWAGETVAKLGDAQTLGALEKHIETQGLTDEEDPAVLTAARLRERLETKRDN